MKKTVLILCLSIGLFTSTARADCDMNVLAGVVFMVSLVATAGSVLGMVLSAPSSESKTESSLVFSGSWVVFPYSTFSLVVSGVVFVVPRFHSMTGSNHKPVMVTDPTAKPLSVSVDDSFTSISLDET